MRKYKRNSKNKVFVNINITPLTDIALTLLVIFMVATPMLIQSNINVNLPKVEHKNDSLSYASNFLTIIIDKTGRIFIENQSFSIKSLELYLKSYNEQNKDTFIVINGDKSANYDSVVKVLDVVKSLGITKISLGIEVNQE